MAKMEIELTEKQMEKVEILKTKDIDVGEAIDLLFKVQNEALAQIEAKNSEEGFTEKIMDSALDSKIKEELLKENYEDHETYDKTLQTTKHKIKWGDYFKIQNNLI